MRIGIIGSGNIGATTARLLVDAGHEVVISNSRGPSSLGGLISELGAGARAGTVEEAAAGGEVVLVAIPLLAYAEVPVGPVAGKVVVDAMNYYPSRDGQIAELDDGDLGSSELFARHLAGDARVVKALNTMSSRPLGTEGRPAGEPGRRAFPIAGDDADAKTAVGGLIDQLGFDAVDGGPLSAGRRQQPGTPVYGVLLDAAGVREALAAFGA